MYHFSLHKAEYGRGFSAVEIVVGISIISLVLLFSIHAIMRSVTTGAEQVDHTRALYLAEEALETARFLHDKGWSEIEALTNDTPYYVDISTTDINVSATPQLVDGLFLQTITLTDVYRRNIDDDIVASTSGSTKYIDPNSRFVTARVYWGTPTSTVSISMYLSNFY